MVDIVLCADKQTCNQVFKQGWEKWVVGAFHWILKVNRSDREVAREVLTMAMHLRNLRQRGPLAGACP